MHRVKQKESKATWNWNHRPVDEDGWRRRWLVPIFFRFSFFYLLVRFLFFYFFLLTKGIIPYSISKVFNLLFFLINYYYSFFYINFVIKILYFDSAKQSIIFPFFFVIPKYCANTTCFCKIQVVALFFLLRLLDLCDSIYLFSTISNILSYFGNL